MIAGRIVETRSSLGASWRRGHRDAIIETGVVWARSGMADGGVPGIEDLSRLGRWLDENGVGRGQERPPGAPPARAPDRRRAIQSDLPAGRRATARVGGESATGSAPPAPRPRVADR